MRGRLLLAALAAALLLPAGGAAASEGSQAKAVGATLRPFAAALPEIDQGIANAVGDAGDATVSRCGAAADAIAGQPAARRAGLVKGLALLHLGLDTLPAANQVLLLGLQFTQDEMQDLRLRSPALRSARTVRRNALKAVIAIVARRESVCPILEPWAAAGFPTDPAAPSFVAVRAANRRAAATLEGIDAAFASAGGRKGRAGAAALGRARVSQRVQAALTLDFELEQTSAAISADAFSARLRRADRAGAPR